MAKRAKTKVSPVRRARTKVSPEPVLTISRSAFQREKIVYILVANKRFHYTYGKSPIIYIGTSKKGASRVGQSVIDKGSPAVESHGVKEIRAYLVTCRLRRRVNISRKLEAALLIVFREKYGKVPHYNKRLGKKSESDEFEYFSRDSLVKILSDFNNNLEH